MGTEEQVYRKAVKLYEEQQIKPWPTFEDVPLLEREHYLDQARDLIRMGR